MRVLKAGLKKFDLSKHCKKNHSKEIDENYLSVSQIQFSHVSQVKLNRSGMIKHNAQTYTSQSSEPAAKT